MYPHEKPGYVDTCRAAGVCPSVVSVYGEGYVYCDRLPEMHPREHPAHFGLTLAEGVYTYVNWHDDDEDCAALEGGAR